MSIVQQINEGLQALGFSQSLAAQLDQFIAFLGVLLVAYLADTVCRKILLKVVSRLVKQTKATWDDIVFDRKVMVHLSRMVAPILIYPASSGIFRRRVGNVGAYPAFLSHLYYYNVS